MPAGGAQYFAPWGRPSQDHIGQALATLSRTRSALTGLAPPRWTVRRPLAWAVGQGVDIAADPLPVVAFSGTCTWRTSVLEALERAGRRWRIAFESNSLAGVLAGLRTGLGVAALMPINLEPAMACHDPDALRTLPDVELGLARHPRTEGDPLIDAVETRCDA